MSEETVTIDEIEVTVSGVFGTRHRFQTGEGLFGECVFPAVSRRASFYAADGRELSMRQKHWWRGEHELLEGEAVRGRAGRRSPFRRAFDVELDGEPYTVEPEGAFSRRWRLADAEGNTLLEIRPRGVFRRGAVLTIRGALADELIPFAYYLVYTRQQEEAAAAGAGA